MGNVAIMQNGKNVYLNSFGVRDIELRDGVNKQTLYRIGSISKTFTATMIMQLIEEEKLSLDTKLSDFFPAILNSDKISVENLLTHQSGIANITETPEFLSYMYEPKTRDELLEIIGNLKSNFNPGEKSEYSNTNFILLTFIAEEIEKKSFEDIFDTRLVKKLKLKRTRFGGKIRPKNNETYSYFPNNGQWQKASESDMSIPLGAGAVVSTPGELNEFFNALFEGKLIDDYPLYEMTKTRGDFGLGIFSFPYKDKINFGHNGAIDGFSSMSFYFPNENTGFSIILNGSKININNIFITMMNIYFGYDSDLQLFKPLDNPETYTGIYTNPHFPLEIEIFSENNFLYAQATGQSSFMLSKEKENFFSFEPADLTIEFFPEEKRLKLTQMGMVNEFTQKE